MKCITYSLIFILVVTSICSCSKKDKEIEQNQQVNKVNTEKIEKYLNSYISEFESNTELIEDVGNILSKYSSDEIPSNSKDKLLLLYNMIFDPNRIVIDPSFKALTIFKKLGAIEVIQESLLHNHDDIISYACDILMELASTDKAKQYSLVPYFIKALDKSNYLVDGTEMGLNHTFMKYKIINNINTITGLDFDINKIDADDPKQIEEVLSKTKDWAQKHDLKLLDEK